MRLNQKTLRNQGRALWHNKFNCSFLLKYQILATLLGIQLSAKVPEKAADNNPSSLAPATYLGDVDKFPGFWLWHGPVPAAAAVWVVNK